jgi:hypothetical protein
MSDKLIELARECGTSSTPIWGPPTVTFTADQLATFRARIRAEAMEEAAQLAERRARDVRAANTRGSRIGQAALFVIDQIELCASAIRAKAGVEGALK